MGLNGDVEPGTMRNRRTAKHLNCYAGGDENAMRRLAKGSPAGVQCSMQMGRKSGQVSLPSQLDGIRSFQAKSRPLSCLYCPIVLVFASRNMTTKGLLAAPERLLDILDRQGSWTEEQYLSLTDHTTRLVEFTDGFLELLPVPTDYHQAIVQLLLYAFDGFLKPLGGKVRIAPLRLRVCKGKFREPDLLLLL
jgi:hypothetical protein